LYFAAFEKRIFTSLMSNAILDIAALHKSYGANPVLKASTWRSSRTSWCS